MATADSLLEVGKTSDRYREKSWWAQLTRRQRSLVYLSGIALAGVGLHTWMIRRLDEELDAPGARRRPTRPSRRIDCDVVTDAGGTLEGIRYLERVTPGADPNQSLPMLVVFHSLGATPEGFLGLENNLHGPARVIYPAGPITTNKGGHRWWDGRAKQADQAELARRMSATRDQVARFLESVMTCRPTPYLPVVTGTSQGGSMAYLMATRPDLVGGAVAVLGWLPEQLWTPNMATTVALHGVNDNTVPFDRTAAYVEAMAEAGAPITGEYFDTGHKISKDLKLAWRDAYNGLLGY